MNTAIGLLIGVVIGTYIGFALCALATANAREQAFEEIKRLERQKNEKR